MVAITLDRVRDNAIADAKDLPSLVDGLRTADPNLAAAITGKSLVASRTPGAILLTSGVTYLAGRYGLGWDADFCALVASGVLLAASYVMRAISSARITSILPKATPTA
jgi:hypothetical protein